MRYRSALLVCGLSFGTSACGSADLYELGSLTPTPSPQPTPSTTSTPNEAQEHWILIERSGLTSRETPHRVEKWLYDGARLTGSEEYVPCRCTEEPRARHIHEYSEREVVSSEDRDIDGTIDFTRRYELDEAGRVARFTNDAGRGYEVSYSYDEAGRLMQTESLIDGITSASRNEAGLLTAIYTGGRTPSYTWSYDEDGRLIQALSHNYPNHYEFTYNDRGQLQTQRYYRPGQFDSQTSYEYDDEGRVARTVAHDEETGAVLVERSYTFDEQGRLITKREIDRRSELDKETRFFYGENGRLAQHESWSGAQLQSTTEYRWSQMRTGDIQLITTRNEDPSSAYRQVFRALDQAPIKPPLLPTLDVDHPTPELPSATIRYD